MQQDLAQRRKGRVSLRSENQIDDVGHVECQEEEPADPPDLVAVEKDRETRKRHRDQKKHVEVQRRFRHIDAGWRDD